MDIDLFAIDVDGTLLVDDFTVPKRVISSLLHLEKTGVKVVLVTARGPSGVRPVLEQLNTSPCVACFNGAWIGSVEEGGAILNEVFIDQPSPVDLWKTAEHVGLDAILYSGNVAFTNSQTKFVNHELGVTGEKVLPIDQFEAGNYQAHKLMVCSQDLEALSTFRKDIAVSRSLSISISESGLLEVTALGADKASAIRFLAKKFGTHMHRVAAIGDNENDIGLLKAAGVGIAVANARDDVQSAAQWVVASNTGCGVAEAAERLLEEM